MDTDAEAKGKFAAYLAELRLGAGMTRAAAAKKLVSLEQGFTSSATKPADWATRLTRLESGQFNVQPSDLEKLSVAYNQPLERLAAAFLAAYVFRSASMPKASDWADLDRPVGSLSAESQQGTDTAFFISNEAELWTLGQLALWERDFTAQTDGRQPSMWIISPDFVDHENDGFLEIVVKDLLLKGVDLTYFIAEQDIGPPPFVGSNARKFGLFATKAFLMIKSMLASGEHLVLDRMGTLSVYGLEAPALTWFTSSLVIANPDELQSNKRGIHGFLIAPLNGKPALGIPLRIEEVRRTVAAINHQMTQREILTGNDAYKSTYERNVLREVLESLLA